MISARKDIVFDVNGGSSAAISIPVAALRVCLQSLTDQQITWYDVNWEETAVSSDEQALIDAAIGEITEVLNGI